MIDTIFQLALISSIIFGTLAVLFADLTDRPLRLHANVVSRVLAIATVISFLIAVAAVGVLVVQELR